MRGFVCIPRDEADPRDELWGGERRLTRFEAWCDLRTSAAIRERVVTFRGERITVPVGGVLFSNRTLQDRWGWTNKTVTAFLRDLERAGLILSLTPTLGGTVMLLRSKDLPVEAEEPAPTLTPTVIPTVIPTRKEKGENVEKKSGSISPREREKPGATVAAHPRFASQLDEHFEAWWRAMPKRPGASKQRARDEYTSAVRRELATVDELQDAAERYAGYVAATGTRPSYVVGADNFLRDWRWNDEWAAPEPEARPERNARSNGAAGVPYAVQNAALREASIEAALDFLDPTGT